jgi:hypothetical protein
VSAGRSLARLVGLTTAASGALLVAAPEPSLRLLGAGADEPAPFLFGVVGMFMTLSGGLLVDGCRSDPPSPLVLRWALAQKVGATTAMCLGVRRGRYGRQALAVAAFDGSAAVLLAWLLLRAER